MDLGIKNKRALVTGGSKGLGRCIALKLAQEGVKVAIVARESYYIDKTIDELGGNKRGHYGIVLDLMHENSPRKVFDILNENFGDVEIVVHNIGGILGIKEPLSSMKEFFEVWKINIGVAIELNRLLIPIMKKKKWGRIIHVSSSSAVTADASLAYSSAKAAINTYVKGLGRKMAEYGITVNSVMPGPFIFEGNHWDFISKQYPDKYKKFISERMGLKRLGTPEEISDVITFLCSERASLFVGSSILVDGGIS